MKASTLFVALLTVICCVIFAQGTRAQSVSGYTSIDYDDFSNTITAYSETTVDYDLMGDYSAYVSLYVYDQNNVAITGRSARDIWYAGYTSVTLQFSATPGATYIAKGYHRGFANLYNSDDFYPYRTYYYDNWRFGLYEGQNIYTPWYHTFLNNGLQQVTRRPRLIYLGGTHDNAIAVVPQQQVFWRQAKIYEQTVVIDDNLRRADINLSGNSHASGICTNFEFFTLIVSFNLPDAASGLSHARSSARGVNTGPGADTNNHDWDPTSFDFANVNLSSTPKSGEMHIRMHRRSSLANEAPSISITLAGDSPTGTFKKPVNVGITCP